jgi:tetratricopeptide (TPR) repeat protein
MPKVARVSEEPDREPERGRAEIRRIPRFKRRPSRFKHRYYAFLSYSHKDEDVADWLHDELEGFRVPRALAGRLTENGAIPKRLAPIFRDEHELAAADDLGEEIEGALASSQFLIVLCSPNAATSHWTNAEIEVFKRTRPDGCVLAAIIDGEPFASEMPGRENEECFPPALRQKYDRRGRPTGQRVEPLAADLRGDGRRIGFLKLVAGMLGVGLDDLVQRETLRRQRRMAWLAAASLGGMAITSTLAITAIQARDSARDQRREAEGLIGFMLGDLKDKLEPVGRLDALDGVGARVLAYYQKQDKSELSDAALSQRSRALSLMGQVTYLRGDLEGSERLYREARAGTEEAMRREGDDPQRLYDHAQNVFWIGEIARQRGDLGKAEAGARDYQRLAQRMVSLAPDNMKWRVEEQNASAQLCIIFYAQRRFAEAARQFEQSLRTIEALATADPRNNEYQKSRAESLAWLADAQLAQGDLPGAAASRQRQIDLLERLRSNSSDVGFAERLLPARQAAGRLFAMTGDLTRGEAELRSAVAEAEGLIATEPKNTLWLSNAASTRLSLAEVLLASGQAADAAAQINSACNAVDSLMTHDRSVVVRRTLLHRCLIARSQLQLSSAATDQALATAARALQVAQTISTKDRIADKYAIALSYRVIGDIHQRMGDATTAREEWQAGLNVLPAGIAERPTEVSGRALLLQRLGRAPEARALTARLGAMGYRRIGLYA